MRNHIAASAARPVIATAIAAVCFGSVAGPYFAMTAGSASASVTISAGATPTPTVTATPDGNPWG